MSDTVGRSRDGDVEKDLEMHARRDMRRTAAPDESESVDNIFGFFFLLPEAGAFL
jgi:hypothetical protein